MDNIAYILILSLSMVTLVCAWNFIVNNVLNKPDKQMCIFTIIPVTVSDMDIEYTVKRMMWSKNWEEEINQYIILVTMNCKEEVLQVCNILCDEYEPVIMCNPEQLVDVVKSHEVIVGC